MNCITDSTVPRITRCVPGIRKITIAKITVATPGDIIVTGTISSTSGGSACIESDNRWTTMSAAPPM